VLVSLLLTSQAQAYEIATEFSAIAVQKVPPRPEFRAKMYVSKHAVRTDSTLNSISVIEIVNTKKQIRWLLVPKDKVYLQQKRELPSTSTGVSKSKSVKPCAGLPQTTCRMLGKESINGRETEKWEFVVERGGKSQRSLHWIDIERNMPVREFFPDGTISELVFKGKEKLNNRKTEKWELSVTHTDGQKVRSLQWYDPELMMTIREEMQGGFVRELRDIKTGSQDKKLFEVPPGYRKIDQLPAYLLPPESGPRPGYNY
jgi:hypothetical protein